MAITLLQQPDPASLTQGGRMQYIFSGNGRLVNTGVFAINALLTFGEIVDGLTLNLFWKGKSLKMVARDTPVEPFEFPSGDGGNDYLLEILPYFRDYFPIEADFVVTAVTNPTGWRGLVFTARKTGPEYNFAGDGGIPEPYALLNGTPGVAPKYRDRYGVFVEVFCKRDGDPVFSKQFEGHLEMDDDGRATLDLSTTLHGYLEPDLPYWHTALSKKAETSAASYYIRYAEAFGEPLQMARVTQLDPLRAYWGGMPYEQKGRFKLADFIKLSADDPGLDRALRNGPALRYVRLDEHQYLTFINLREARTGVSVSYQVTYDNGNKQTFGARIDPFDLPEFGKITIPAGLPQLKLQIPAGRQIREYTVRLMTEAGPISQAYRYIVNYQYQSWVRYFAFISSLGAVDTLSTFGKGSQELALFRQEAERVLSVPYELADGQFVEYDTAYQQQFDVATGWRSLAELSYLNDFYRADRRWRLLADRDSPVRTLPIGVTSKSIKQKVDGQTNFAHKFDYVHLFRDEFYLHQEEGDPLPPLNFVPSGSVTVQPVQTTSSFDRTIPEVVREIKPEDVTKWNEAASRPDPTQQGYLTQASAAPLFSPKNHTHTWDDILNKPDLSANFEPQDIDAILADLPVNGEMEIDLKIGSERFTLGDVLLGRFRRFL